MMMVSKISPQIFETYLASCPNGVSIQILYIILGLYEKSSSEFHQWLFTDGFIIPTQNFNKSKR